MLIGQISCVTIKVIWPNTAAKMFCIIAFTKTFLLFFVANDIFNKRNIFKVGVKNFFYVWTKISDSVRCVWSNYSCICWSPVMTFLGKTTKKTEPCQAGVKCQAKFCDN